MENNDLYQIVLNEIKSGIYDNDLWQEVLKNNNGNITEAENEYIEYRIARLKEEGPSGQNPTTEHFESIEEKSNKKNTVIGISVLFILIVLIVLLGYLLHDYFN